MNEEETILSAYHILAMVGAVLGGVGGIVLLIKKIFWDEAKRKRDDFMHYVRDKHHQIDNRFTEVDKCVAEVKHDIEIHVNDNGHDHKDMMEEIKKLNYKIDKISTSVQDMVLAVAKSDCSASSNVVKKSKKSKK